MIAWVPYRSLEHAAERLGELPDGLELRPFLDQENPPGPPSEVEFLVLPVPTSPRTLAALAEMGSLRVIQTQTAGYEDVAPHVPEGVTLCNATGVHDASTAELAIGLALASGRRLDEAARAQAAHRWEVLQGVSLADRAVLILGYGSIGAAIERRLAGFEVASVTRVARRARPEAGVHSTTELDRLLPEADVVFVIAPLTEQTRGILDARRLALLPDGALVVNVARGKLVDTDALVAELRTGRLRAALDVTDPEPLPEDHPLWSCPGAIVVPHIGGASTAFAPRRDRLVADQLRRWATGEPLANRVN